MLDMEETLEPNFDMAEIWRQNYEDALDEIRNLRQELAEIRFERDTLEHQLNLAEGHIFSVKSD